MIKIKIFAFNPFDVNTYILTDENNECIIIDAGNCDYAENKELADYLTSNQLKPLRLICTHCHIDHILGNRFLFNEFGLLPECHTAEQMNLSSADSVSGIFGVPPPNSPKPEKWLNENDIISFGNSELKVLFTPGHSPGHITLYSESDKFIICGDVLFDGSIGRTDLPGGNYRQLIESINSKLFVLPDEVVVYPGHFKCTTIGKEKRSNPFMDY